MTPPTQLTLRDYLVPVRERKWMILAIVVAIAGVVAAYEARRPTSYTASTKVFVAQNSASSALITNVVSLPSIEDETTLLTSEQVAAVVARKLGYGGPPGALAAGVTAAPGTNGSFVEITATEGSSPFAAQVANAFAQQFVVGLIATQVAANDQQIAGLSKQLRLFGGPANAVQRAQVQGQIEQLQINSSLAHGSARQIDVATPPGPNPKHSPLEYGALAALASLLGSILLAYMLHRFDPRLSRVDEASTIYAHPVLATVPHDPRIEHFADGAPGLSDRSRESFRALRVSLDLASPAGRFSTILITSAGSGEGKSTVARNLAIAFAEAGRRTAVIDADLRKASLARQLRIEPAPGLTDALAGPDAEAAAVRRVAVASAELTVIPAGSPIPNPPAVLESAAFRELLHKTSERHEVVIIDSAPVTAVSDALPVMAHVNAVVLVARNGITDRRNARRAADVISRVPGANVVGVVVNDVPVFEAAAYGVGYGYEHSGGGVRAGAA